jgi:hypothetical protein
MTAPKTITKREKAVLIEAYHVAYDHCEAMAALPFKQRFEIQDVPETLRAALAAMFRAHGIVVPHRYDGDGRTVENGGL